MLLISTLFIILAARIKLDQIFSLGYKEFLFVVILVLVIRPLSVVFSTVGSRLTWREKVFIAWMAPRGIVAAAVASVFSLNLLDKGVRGAELIVPVIFIVIVSTVIIYGMTSGLVARVLGVSQSNPQGILIAGAHVWARNIANILKKEGIQVLLIDTNWENIHNCRMEGLNSFYGNILSEENKSKIELEGIVRILAITPNDEINSLAAMEYSEFFEKAEVYQLAVSDRKMKKKDIPLHLIGRRLFGENVTYDYLSERFAAGAIVKSTKLTDEYKFSRLQTDNGKGFLELFTIKEDGNLLVSIFDRKISHKSGDVVIYVTDNQ